MDEETKARPRWANRIVSQGVKPASQFLANPANPRRHPPKQRAAVNASLKQLGWLQNVIESAVTGNLIDGHERVWQALQNGDADVPFIQVNLSPEEERLALAVYDPISALAETDSEQLNALLSEVQTEEPALQELLAELAAANKIKPLSPKVENTSSSQSAVTCPACGWQFELK